MENQLASKIRVVDKVPPSTGWLNAQHKVYNVNIRKYYIIEQAIFQNVDFCQANLANPASCERVFRDDDGGFDYVFNLAAETKYGQTDEVCHHSS